MNVTKAMMPELMNALGAIMIIARTGEETAAHKGGYSSPEGKSITNKQPDVMT